VNAARSGTARLEIPATDNVAVRAGKQVVQLTNLQKVFWPELGLTKRDLLQYYADISPVLLPHLTGRAMVMKRYPNGIHGKWFFMKRTPSPRPAWLETCEIMHKSENLIAFPMIQDLASLLWVVNLGCIDLNPWYARCDDVDRPDYLHFDLDPGEGAGFDRVLETAIVVRDALRQLGMAPLVKTSGSKGMHVYVPIVRAPTQKDVWTFAKAFAKSLDEMYPKLITAEYRIAERPHGRVLVDYNQNAWGRTLASIYSPRPTRNATVSTPVAWDDVERGFQIADFRIDNIPERVRKLGDLWKPLLSSSGRFRLERFVNRIVTARTATRRAPAKVEGQEVASMAQKSKDRKKATTAKPTRGSSKPGPGSASAQPQLAEYRRKRDFTRTAEPKGSAARPKQTLAFVIQKHAASHLHYDLRLELDGVMKSWAVPKGPSLDPAVRRLAMEVEDHPIEYNKFEGTIPQGEYGGGTVMLWDRGTYGYGGTHPDPLEGLRRGYAKGDLKFVLNGKRLKGSWALVRMRRDQPGKPQWLLIKHRDEYAVPGSDVAAEHQTSVATGRSMEDIAGGRSRIWRSNRPAKETGVSLLRSLRGLKP
jgi:bifunctional non-homologous end joining protein LigD